MSQLPVPKRGKAAGPARRPLPPLPRAGGVLPGEGGCGGPRRHPGSPGVPFCQARPHGTGTRELAGRSTNNSYLRGLRRLPARPHRAAAAPGPSTRQPRINAARQKTPLSPGRHGAGPPGPSAAPPPRPAAPAAGSPRRGRPEGCSSRRGAPQHPPPPAGSAHRGALQSPGRGGMRARGPAGERPQVPRQPAPRERGSPAGAASASRKKRCSGFQPEVKAHHHLSRPRSH